MPLSLVEETGVSRKNHRPVASHWQTLSHNVALSTPHPGFIHFFVEQNQGLFKDFPGQKLQFSSTFFWAFSYIKPCLTIPFFKWKCLYPVRKMMDVQCQWFCGWRYFCVCLMFCVSFLLFCSHLLFKHMKLVWFYHVNTLCF